MRTRMVSGLLLALALPIAGIRPVGAQSPGLRSAPPEASGADSGSARPAGGPRPVVRADFDPPGTLYVVGTAHLDTQWRWTVKETIEEMLPATLRLNFELFDRHPDYVFSFEGAFRYMLMREYYPAEYERLKREVAAGRWRVAGSWVDAVDTNMPSPESLIRQVLYGNGFFRREFGKTSADVFLPDCFGFGYALPSIAAHCGLTGFSTQKLTWGSAVGVPFDIGIWEGVDGSQLLCALNPGEYVGRIGVDLSADSAVFAAVRKQGEKSGVYAAYRYFGTGDQGGSPAPASVEWLEKSLRGAGPVRVRPAASDQLARDLIAALNPEELLRLPQYKGELLMTDHGAGCYTSQAEMKRLNRKNERIADAAERAAVVADWLGGMPYPKETLREAWIRFLWHQFHDDLTGTSVPEAYNYSWNDEAISYNQFHSVLDDAVGTVCRALDRQVKGIPLVVYNPLATEREDLVEATMTFGVVPTGPAPKPAEDGKHRVRGFIWGRSSRAGEEVEANGGVPRAIRVFGPDGREVPAQILQVQGPQARIVFLARVPSVGFAVYDVRGAESRSEVESGLAVGANMLANDRYLVAIDAEGDIASIIDRKAGRELLSGPIRLQLIEDRPWDWPAWEVDYDDLMAPAEIVRGRPEIRIRESGPARVAVAIVRQSHGSMFTQVLSLGAGAAGNRLECAMDIDWNSPGRLLKAAFPFSISNETVTYDLGLGTIARGVNRRELYEVPAQQWADLSDAYGTYGIAVLNDSRHGWDRPEAHVLRLSLVRTPEVDSRWQWVKDQGSQDLGHHRLTWAVCGHAGDWRDGQVAWEADRLNQPLRAWQAPPGRGPLGRTFSLLSVDSPAVAVQAVKRAEETGEIVVRLQERLGRSLTGVHLRFARPVAAARELNGAEEPLIDCPLAAGALELDFRPYQPRTFAVLLDAPPARLEPPSSIPLVLPFDVAVLSPCRVPNEVDFDGEGRSIPIELWPALLEDGGIHFATGPASGRAAAVACAGQEIALPQGDWNRVYLLAASVGGDRGATFLVDERPLRLRVQDWAEPIGQWDSRLVGGRFVERREEIMPGYVKPGRIAWVGTHRHTRAGDPEAYAFAQIYRCRIDLPSGARSLRLPDDPRIRVFAASAARNRNDDAHAAFDAAETSRRTAVRIEATRREFLDSTRVRLSTPNDGATIRYTLDGATPTESSPIYEEPLTLTGTTTVRARALRPGMDSRFVASLTVERMRWRDAIPEGRARPGLLCEYYEGRWSRLPDFASLKPARRETVRTISIPTFARKEFFGLRFHGYLRVPVDGLYTLHLWSDDGSALWLDEEKVIDHDGLHGNGEAARQLALRAGYHAIRVEYFQAPGDRALDLTMEGAGLSLSSVPAEMLGH